MLKRVFDWFENGLDPFPDRKGESASETAPPSDLVKFCLFYSRDAMPWLIAMAIISALIAVGEVMLFGFLGQLVDWLSEANKTDFLNREKTKLILIGMTLLIFLPGLVFLSSLIIHQTLLGNMPMISRWLMHQKLLDQSLVFFTNEFAGRIATKVMQTALAVRETVIKILDIAVYVLVYFITMLALVAAADWRLSIPLIVWLLAYILIIRYFVPRLKKTAEIQADARSAMTGRIVDSYTNISTVKLFSHAGNEKSYAKESMRKFLDSVHPQMRLVTQFEICVYLINCITVLAIGALAIFFWLDDLISIGAIAAAIALTLRINGMSEWVMWEISSLFENIGVIHDGMKMLNEPIAIQDKPGAVELKNTNGGIRFKNIKFHYGKKGGVIDDLSLTIKPGEKIGLVGRSGAGKTTLTNLLLRLYDLDNGNIFIDDHDIASLTQESLRRHVGVVTQDTALLHRSIRDNIIYGKPEAREEDIHQAIKRANADIFIDELTDQNGRQGLDAHAGERGVKLSGGQRQRIAIARIFLKNAPILILDEATSALDSEVEMAIQDNLFDLMDGKTVIAIAHRLSTIAQMDRLIVIDKGMIVEEGSHKNLIEKDGLYADLWKRQSGGFLADKL